MVLGASPRMRAIARIIRAVADTDATVLIRGERGVGKDYVARSIHAVSPRRANPFVKIDCAAIPVHLLESELFGDDQRAFPDRCRRAPGQLERADGRTIYLDEITELPVALQVRLLHVLDPLRTTRVGRLGSGATGIRVIAATDQNLEDAIARGELRTDLYDRLNVVEITVPPLRERPEEIPALASEFLARFNAQYRRHTRISPAEMVRLTESRWPGNVRELENVIRRLVVRDREPAIAGVVGRSSLELVDS
jgi:DNA-binding NtrC family response regulator